MNRKRLGILVGVAAIALMVYRRWSRWEPVDITIDDPEPAEADPPSPEATDLEAIPGIGPAYADRLRNAGIEDSRDLADTDPAELAASTDIGENRIRGWIDNLSDRSSV